MATPRLQRRATSHVLLLPSSACAGASPPCPLSPCPRSCCAQVRRKLHRVYVVDGAGKPTSIITLTDILRLVSA